MSENLKSAGVLKNDCLSPDTRTKTGMFNSATSDTFLNRSGTTTDAPKEFAGLPNCSADYGDKKMIDPSFFDKFASSQDDPSVVRYSQRTGAIAAATPARIVAQISSEAFMDYELVSDFF